MAKKNKKQDITDNLDPRLFERELSKISKYLDSNNPHSEEEIKNLQDKFFKNQETILNKQKKSNLSDFEKAQEIIYSALESDNSKKRVLLAKKALSISPNVVEAYNILAEEENDITEKLRLYQKAMTEGKRVLGEKFLTECKGHYWGFVEARPFMRACMNFAEILWINKEHEMSIAVLYEILENNVNDNMGARYPLISFLLYFRKLKDVKALLDKYEDECSIHWNYSKVLYWLLKGDKFRASKEYDIAYEENPYFFELLFGLSKPPEYLPNRIAVGSRDEAYEYFLYSFPAWLRYKSAMDWLMKKGLRQYIDPKDGLIKLPEIFKV